MATTYYSDKLYLFAHQGEYALSKETTRGYTLKDKKYPLGTSSSFKKDDFIVRMSDGKQYKCTKEGYAWGNYKVAQFVESGYAAILKPDAPKNLSTPTRSNYTYSTKWTAANTNGTNAKRPTYVWSGWKLSTQSGSTTRTVEYWIKLAAGATSSSFNLNDFVDYYGDLRYNRNSFYPKTSTKVKSITNSVGNYNTWGSVYSSTTYTFDLPRKPSIGQWSFDKNNGEISFHVKTNEGKDRYERLDTRIIVKQKSATGKWQTVDDVTTTSTDWSKTIDLSDYAGLDYSQYLQVKVEAWSRGLAGDSEHVTSSSYVGFPALATITKARVTGLNLESRFTVDIKTNSSGEHWVQQVKLEYLADVDYQNATDIPGNAEWTDSGIVDDAQCTALSISVQDLIPSPGKYTWYRIKTWCRNEDVLYRYTYPQRIKELEKPAPTAQDETISILRSVSLSASYNDGKTVALLLGWNKDGQDDATGTELTWSTDVNGWRSVTAPSVYEFTWSDGVRGHGGVSYRDSATIYIHNLEENVPVHFKARRYMVDADERVTYSPYSNTFTVTPTKVVEAGEVNVSVVADATIPDGKSYPVSWSYDTDVVQTQWQIMTTNNVTISSGTGTNQAYQIPANRLKSFANAAGVVRYKVRVLVSGAWITSATRTVNIISAPELTLDVAATLTAQPLDIDVECDQPASVKLIVASEGVDGQRPSGIKRQSNGDVVYSALINPEWTYANNVYSATLELPGDLELLNNGNYTVEATPINTYGVDGETQEATVNIDWAHTAGLPNATITPVDEEDASGRTLGIKIELAAPEGATQDDVYDIYRLTADGATLIMEGVEQDAVILDKCAPFGSVPTYVRVATRTVDGDATFIDYNYTLPADYMRIDWEDNYVELPYNITIQDGYTKDVDIRKHMDGTQDGYWNSSVSRTGALGSTLVQLWQQESVDSVKALARYTGAAFVRTPDGSAYTADVQVTDVTPDGNRLTTVAISATEIDLVESFMAEKVEAEE